jgi:two-component system, chemotaxis family, protein-glutamate methylesterase/glutaminase
MEMISVFVVDDSACMRRAITKMLESEPGIRVVATARNGEEAVTKARAFDPDVITMDVEMPGFGGLEAVRQRFALELGAVDFVAKPDAAYVNITDVTRDIAARVRAV